jgi:RNA-directed DNA polymerase
MRYKVYPIPKRSGRGTRTIAQPSPAVKELQQWVVSNVLKDFAVHEAATAYKKSSSILKNASAHKDNRFLLKMDFENFFNSINSGDLLNFLDRRKAPMEEGDRRLLSRILFWRPVGSSNLVMSIGAPSSPVLCNILMYDFDVIVERQCKTVGVTYTRYADDMTFSCDAPWRLKEIEIWVTRLVEEIQSPKLRVNPSKTVHVSKKSNRRVTGLVLANSGTISLGRDRKRKLRAMVHRFLNGGMAEADVLSLRGWLAYVNGVEPSFTRRLQATYGVENLARLGLH